MEILPPPRRAPNAPLKALREHREPPGCLFAARLFFYYLIDIAEKRAGEPEVTAKHIEASCRKLRAVTDYLTRGQDAMQKLGTINNSLQQMLKPQKLRTNPKIHLALCEELLGMLKEQIELAKKADPNDIGVGKPSMQRMIKAVEDGIPEIEDKIRYLILHGELPADERGLIEIQLKKE
ncbi:MAG: hypothetical protein WC759_02090 [Candidatus Micrarchaeia archaeon]|jgi:hypothetical protein